VVWFDLGCWGVRVLAFFIGVGVGVTVGRCLLFLSNQVRFGMREGRDAVRENGRSAHSKEKKISQSQWMEGSLVCSGGSG